MEVTRMLARYIVNARPEDVPKDVKREAVRSIVNWLGCTVGSCRHEAVDCALAAITPFSGPAQASVLGREEKVDILHASLLNGISSHVFDFDDTHLRTIILRCVPSITRRDGTSPAPQACSDRPRHRGGCLGSTNNR